MTHRFDDAVLAGVLGHMNADHADDNLLIVRAYSCESAVTRATMTHFDGDGGDWRALTPGGDEIAVRVPWPGGPITERAAVRREVVAVYDDACRRLQIEPRPHA